MSDCSRYRDALLEADVEELSGVGDTPLAAHVRSCSRCRAAGLRIHEQNAALDRALSVRRSVEASTIVARARDERRRPPSVPRAWPSRRWIVLAAAASLAALLVWSDRDRPLEGAPWMPTSMAPPVVEAPADRNVAVFETDDPDITVIWFFQEEG